MSEREGRENNTMLVLNVRERESDGGRVDGEKGLDVI